MKDAIITPSVRKDAFIALPRCHWSTPRHHRPTGIKVHSSPLADYLP